MWEELRFSARARLRSRPVRETLAGERGWWDPRAMRLRSMIPLLVLGFGCGGDGGGDDPVADAAPVDQPDLPQAVTLTITLAGGPAVGVDVVFGNPDGSVLERAVSGADGTITRDLPADSVVTIVPATGSLATFSFVQPGDTLRFELDPTPRSVGDVRINLPAAFPGATRYQVNTGCGAGQTVNPLALLTIPITMECVGDSGRMALFAIAIDDAAQNPILAATSLGGVAVDIGGGGADATLPAWNAGYDTFDLSISNVDVNAPRLGASAGENADGVVFVRSAVSSFDGVVTSFPVNPDLGTAVRYGIAFGRDPVIVGAKALVTDQFDFRAQLPSRLTASYDFADDPLAPITALDVDITTPTRPIASVTSAATDLDIIAYGLTDGVSSWTLLAPGTATTLTLPDLPEGLRDRWSPTGDVAITAILAKSSDFDYDGIRNGLAFGYLIAKPFLAGPDSTLAVSIGSLAATSDPARMRPRQLGGVRFPTRTLSF